MLAATQTHNVAGAVFLFLTVGIVFIWIVGGAVAGTHDKPRQMKSRRRDEVAGYVESRIERTRSRS